MGVLGAEVGRPGVQVRIEVHQRDQAVRTVHRPQQRACDRVIPAQANQRLAARGETGRGPLHLVCSRRISATP